MSNTFATVPCDTCAAPCRPGHEHTSHQRSCRTIAVGRAPRLLALRGVDLVSYCTEVAAADQASAHLRETTKAAGEANRPQVDGINRLINPPPGQDPYGKWASWRERQGQTYPTPEGKTTCGMCNGITHMYPNCSGCDGKGYL